MRHRYKALADNELCACRPFPNEESRRGGADIACGDAQSLGMPLLTVVRIWASCVERRPIYARCPDESPERLTDADGHRTFVLTLQAREQHIRRDKATSNIYTNSGTDGSIPWCIFSLLGDDGLREAAMQEFNGAHYLASVQLEATGRMRS